MKLQFHLPSLIEFVKYDDDNTAVDSKILRAQRPILKIRSIFPYELDSVVTITLTGKHQRASILTVSIIDEKGKTLEKNFLHADMSREEDAKYLEKTGLHPTEYLQVQKETIYDNVKGTTEELIRDFYNIPQSNVDQRVYRTHYIFDDSLTRRMQFVREFVGIDPSLSHERFYKHFCLSQRSVEDFEKKIAQTSEYIWRESLLP